jgi:DNA-binding beta-propeller fold protein YncE
MRLYIRKDIISQLWNYGATPTPEEVFQDPYEGKQIAVSADRVVGGPGSEAGQFTRPRDIAVAPDGSLYIADTENHRIQHLAPDGSVLHVWGSFGSLDSGNGPAGTFNEPWGVAVGLDGSVYVADVWNHRIQKFSPEGEFQTMWGTYGQADSPTSFFGPRDVAVDPQGNLLVTDTGNDRVVVFDPQGIPISQFGSSGLEPGQFDEPVAVAVDPNGLVYVTDTWNQRIQVFEKDASGEYRPLRQWDMAAWYGQSRDNKPYLAVGGSDTLYVTDPEGARILEFTTEGEFIRYFGNFGSALDGFGLAAGVAADPQGGLWVTDAGNSRLMHFTLPGR